MKNRTLTLLAACLFGISAYAQWTAPEATNPATLTSGHNYLIKNTAIDDYCLGGAKTWYSWSTSLALVSIETDNPITYQLTASTDTTYSDKTVWTLQDTSNDKYTFLSGVMDSGLGELHVDMDAQGHQYFEITKVSDEPTYHISLTSSDTLYTNHYSGYLGVIPESDSYPNAVYAFLDPDEEGYACEWIFIDADIYNARLALYNLAETCLAYSGMSAALSTAADVYNNSSSTASEIEAATTTLREAFVSFLVEGASTTNPADLTSVIENHDFSEGDISGWTCTFVSGVNATDVGYQGDEYTNSAYNYTNHEGSTVNPFISGFIQAWAASGTVFGTNPEVTTSIGDAELSQTLTNMPGGQYKLSADVIAVQQWENATMTVTGTELFATGGDIDNYESISTANNTPEHIELNFISTGGEIKLGLRTVNTTANWIAADNFELLYYGEFEQSAYYTLLQNTVEEASAYDDNGTYHYSAAVMQALEDAIDDAKDLLDGTASDEELQAGNETLKAVIETVKASIDAYTNFAAYLEEVGNDRDDYTTNGYSNIADPLADLYTEAYEHYNACDIEAEGIQEYIDGYSSLLSGLVKDALPSATADNPLNISVLCTNMDYADNTNDGWTKVSDTGNGNVSYHCSEVWSSAFTNLQTISDMPAGSYTLKAKALYRTASNQPGYIDYIDGTDEVLTYLVVADGKAQVVNHAAGAIEADSAPYDGYVELSSYPGIYVPNSMQAAEYAFNLNDVYECQASGYLLEEGDLTFGLRNDGPVTADCWSIWSQLRLYYCGTSTIALYTQLQQLIEETLELQDVVFVVAEADRIISDAIMAAEEMTGESSEEELLSAIESLQAAIDYGNKSLELVDELMQNWDIYQTLTSEYESTDTSFDTLLDVIGYAVLNEEFESNEQIEQWLTDLATGWTAHVQCDNMNATEDEPTDITAAVLNPYFEGIGGGELNQFWDITYNGGSSTGSYNAYECYNNTDFDVQQTIIGLAEGYYRVGIQALYRAGTNAINADSLSANADYGQNVVFSANTVAKPICNVISGGQTEATEVADEVSVTYNGSTVYIPNSMSSFADYVDLFPNIYWTKVDVGVTDGKLTIRLRKTTHLNDDWTIWNQVQLLYLGTQMPTGIEALQDSGTGEGEAVATAIFSLDGKRLSKLTKGINIVKTTMADGTVKTTKVLVK